MKALITMALILSWAMWIEIASIHSSLPVGTLVNHGHWVNQSVSVTEYPRRTRPTVDIPSDFSWTNYNGVNYVNSIVNQHTPQFCGSSWALATVGVLNDRIKIMRKAAWPDIQLSPQVLLSCDKSQRGCEGGFPLHAFKWIKEHGISDSSCSPYQSKGHTNGLEWSNELECIDWTADGWKPKDLYNKYFVDDYGTISGEQEMLEEIVQNGPIACSWTASKTFQEYKGGILVDLTKSTEYNHVWQVVGFGVENGIKYWQVKNTWGTTFGENGFIRIIRGVNNAGIENSCSWAIPQDTWSSGKEVIMNKASNTLIIPAAKINTNSTKKVYPSWRVGKSYFIHGEKVRSSRPGLLYRSQDFPSHFDWRDILGFNFVLPSMNQNSPFFWNSCWAIAPVSALADRFNILQKKTEMLIELNPQAVINWKAGGTCQGGNPGEVYEFVHLHGMPDSSCFNYEAADYPDKWEPIDVCRTCSFDNNKSSGNWTAINNYHKYFVSEYGYVYGIHFMKSEIIQRGPISCGIHNSEGFTNYKSGIYSEEDTFDMTLNHEVVIVGWGTTPDGQEYWIGRNSYGSTWGENGYFRINMHGKNLNINMDCIWAIPVTNEALRLEYDRHSARHVYNFD